MSDKIRFFNSFLRSPKSVGSVTPSSSFLARKMMQPIDWEQTHAIAELGAGTGVFTHHIASQLQSERCGLIFEQDETMRAPLQDRYPHLHFHENALELTTVMNQMGMEGLDVVVSGLPFANFSQTMRQELITQIDQSLRSGGIFIAFQYSLQMKKMLKQTFSNVEISFVPLNIPPAFVYCCRKL